MVTLSETSTRRLHRRSGEETRRRELRHAFAVDLTGLCTWSVDVKGKLRSCAERFWMVVAPLGVARASVSELPLASSTVVRRLRKITSTPTFDDTPDN